MSTAFRVGVFAVATVVAIFIVWAVLGNLSLRRNSYQLGIHFTNVVGLQEGGDVQVAGVDVGVVDSIRLLPDQTAEVICSINGDHAIYRGSIFTVTSTLTGQSTLSIYPPRNLAGAVPLPRHVLPEGQQPEGLVPPTIADLVSEGQAQLKSLTKTLAIVNKQLPLMVAHFNGIATKTETLIDHTDRNFTQLGNQLNSTVASVSHLVGSAQSLLQQNGQNITSLTVSLHELVASNGPRLTNLLNSLSSSADNLNKTMATVSSIASDPSLKANFLTTTANLKDSSEKLKSIATDIENITGDPQVQTQLKGAVQNFSSAIARANQILGNVANAQGAGQQGQQPAPEGSPAAPGQPQPASSSLPQEASQSAQRLHRVRPGKLGFDVAQLQLRETWNNGTWGPASEINIELLPRWPTHVTVGAYDIGYQTSYNALLNMRAAPNLAYSVGVYHSYLGLTSLYQPFGALGIDLRVYDPKRPKVDLYGDIKLARRLELFYGERSLFGPGDIRTPQYGFQFNY